MRKPLVHLLVLSFLFSFSSCSNFEDAGEIDEVKWNAELAAPLAQGKISLQDILDEVDDLSFLEVNNDGSMNVYYEDDPQSQSVSEWLGTFPDFPLAITDTVMSVPFTVFPDFSVSSVDLKVGTLSFRIHSQLEEDVDVTITIPSLTKNGVPFRMSTRVLYQGSLPATSNIDATSIEGYVLAANAGNIELGYDARTLNGDRVEVSLITGAAENWAYSIVEGVWANGEFELKKDSIEINIFDNWVDGDITLTDPKLTIDVDNSFGFATRVSVKSLVVTTIDGEKIPLESEILDDGFMLDFPSINEQGDSRRTSFTFDRNNSNIDVILNSRPTGIVYEIIAEINPDGSTDPGFTADDSEIVTTVKVDIPVYGTAAGFTIENETEVDLDDFDNVEKAEIKILSENEIPIDLNVQIYFADANNQVFDSLFVIPNHIVKAAKVDANGVVTENTVDENYIDISSSRFELLRQAENLKIHAGFSTYNDGQVPVRITTLQELDLKLGIKVETKN